MRRSSVTKFLIIACTGLTVPNGSRTAAAQALVQRVDRPASVVSGTPEGAPPAIRGAVWAVAPAADGWMAVGSNSLTLFDGVQWTPLAVPEGAYAFRALARGHDGRVWVGGINALGYAARGSNGEWRFHSLLPALQSTHPEPLGDVWTVHAAGPGAVWVASDRIVRWMPRADAGEGTLPEAAGTFEVWMRRARLRLLAFPGPDGLWIFQEGEGLLHLGTEGPPVLVCPAGELPEQPVTWLATAPTPGGAALAGLGNSVYVWDGARRFHRLDSLSAELRGKVPTTAAWLDTRRLAIGTFKAGVFLAETEAGRGFPDGTDAGDFVKIVSRITGADGLEDDKVNALWGDESNLWIGSTDGLSRVAGPGHARWFDRRTALAKGAPHSVFEHDGVTCIATNKQLFRLGPDGTPDPIASSQPELMAAASIGPELWTSGFGGVWRGEAHGREQCYHTTGDVPCISASRHFPGGALILDGYELKALKPSATGIAVHDLGARVSDTPVALHEAADGDIWVSTLIAGLRRFGWRETAGGLPQLRLKTNFRPRLGLPASAQGARLVPVGARLFAFTAQDILALNSAGTGFEPVPELQAFRGLAAVAASAPGDEAETVSYWAVRLKAAGELAPPALLRVRAAAAGPISWEPLLVPGFSRVGTITRVDWIAGPASPALWFSGTHGLLAVAESALRRAPPSPPPPPLALSDARNPRREFGAAAVVLPADVRRLGFDYRVPTAVSGAVLLYQTLLDGVDDTWTAPAPAAARALENLAPGRYEFRVRTLDAFGQTSPPQRRSFTVLAPWWRTAPAFAGYAVLALVTGAGLARWRSRHLRAQNERLNRLVAQRTREIELASTAKSEFLENVSHEIRNPLNGLSGLLNLMKEDRFDPRERELARSLRVVVGDLQRVFEEVLSFSKLEYGYAKLRKRPFRLRRSLGEIVELFTPVARQQGCTLQLEWNAPEDDAFEGDESKIKTVISNFVSNALKYAPGGPIAIHVEANPRDAGAIELYIEVRDAGPGVPTGEQELIFKKFVRGSNVVCGGVAGTGLGLATCRVLAQIMHGNVGIESPLMPRTDTEPARGSLFYLRVLLSRPAPDEAPTAGSPDATPAAPPKSRATDSPASRALIVEDEPYNRIVLEGIALELGYAADLADSAPAALEKLATHPYAVVFLDWELPGGNGGEIARRLRTQPGGATPLILAVTAHDSDEIRAQCFAAGMDGFLLKPYDVAAVRALLEGARARRDGTAPPPESFLPKRSGMSSPDVTLEPLNLRAFAQHARARPASSHSAPELFALAIEAELRALAAALAATDVAALAAGAHRLRALGGLIDARSLLKAARALESAAHRNAEDDLAASVATVATAGAQIVTRVRRIELR